VGPNGGRLNRRICETGLVNAAQIGPDIERAETNDALGVRLDEMTTVVVDDVPIWIMLVGVETLSRFLWVP
jgi:hypothetical protein